MWLVTVCLTGGVFILAVEYKNFLETGLNNKFNHQLRPAQKTADLMKLYTQKKKDHEHGGERKPTRTYVALQVVPNFV